MVLSGKMRLFELASSSFFHLFLTIFLLCYFELFPVTGAGINLFLPLRTCESDCCISNVFRTISQYEKSKFHTLFIHVTAIAPGPIWHATLKDSGPSTISYPGNRSMISCFHS